VSQILNAVSLAFHHMEKTNLLENCSCPNLKYTCSISLHIDFLCLRHNVPSIEINVATDIPSYGMPHHPQTPTHMSHCNSEHGKE
jgi:hypothetical protein